MGSFSTPLSGLMAAQDQLQSVSNNLANIDTNGFKDQTLTFGDIFAEADKTNGAGNPLQTGAGVAVSSTDSNFTEGNLNSTSTSSNMAISGNGFFVTQSASGSTDYTRAGDFTVNSAGELTTPNGELVMGYPATAGVVNTSGTLQPLQVSSGVTMPAQVSTKIGFTENLDSDTAVGGTATSSTLAVYDSLGSSHNLSITYTKTAANTWTYSVTVPSADLTGATGTTWEVGSGQLNFNTDGSLNSVGAVGGTIAAPGTPVAISLGGPGSAAVVGPPAVAAVPATTLADGAASPLTLSGPFGTVASPTITQNAGASTTSTATTDGFQSGTLSTFSVQTDGTIEGKFSNGSTLAVGQVAVASFANVQGLSSTGNNNYQPTAASGSAVIGLAGTGGRGTIIGGDVEQSNVNIATEFAKLIVAQQAYSANAKAITTFNQVSQATLAMIQ
jgi:flagellar hook protein FlgE